MVTATSVDKRGFPRTDSARYRLSRSIPAALAILAACARTQTGYWRNSESLWTRALACTSNNALAESNLASFLYQEDRRDEALAHGQKALDIQPDNVGANNCVGFVLLQKGHVDEAIAHINRYSTKHSDSIVTREESNARKFLRGVDSAAVYWNASTRFTDGAEFGFGAEMGISTQKLHCRGPFALAELTSSKYEIIGAGQVR